MVKIMLAARYLVGTVDMSVLIKLRDFNSFSSAEADVRDFVLNNPRRALSMTIYELANASFTSPSTVSRMCKRLGLKSYREFRILLAEEVEHFDRLQLDLLDSTMIERYDTSASVIEKITNIETKTIEETRILVDEKVLGRVVALFRDAHVLDFYGVGASNLVAMDAQSKFMRVGKCSIVFQHYDRQYVQALNSDSTHVGVIFSYSGETTEMCNIARVLKENSVPIVSVTKSDENTVGSLAEYRLVVTARETLRRSGAMASRTAQLYIVDLLYSLYIMTDYDLLIERIGRTLITP